MYNRIHTHMYHLHTQNYTDHLWYTPGSFWTPTYTHTIHTVLMLCTEQHRLHPNRHRGMNHNYFNNNKHLCCTPRLSPLTCTCTVPLNKYGLFLPELGSSWTDYRLGSFHPVRTDVCVQHFVVFNATFCHFYPKCYCFHAKFGHNFIFLPQILFLFSFSIFRFKLTFCCLYILFCCFCTHLT